MALRRRGKLPEEWVRFLVDNQLPVALARWLREQGHEAEHVLDLGLGQAADEVIWRHAVEVDAVIVTKDEDFAQLTILRPGEARVVWLRVGNCRTAVLLATWERVWPRVLAELGAGSSQLIEIY